MGQKAKIGKRRSELTSIRVDADAYLGLRCHKCGLACGGECYRVEHALDGRVLRPGSVCYCGLICLMADMRGGGGFPSLLTHYRPSLHRGNRVGRDAHVLLRRHAKGS